MALTTSKLETSLYRNNGNGTFTKIVEGALVTDRGSSNGGAWGDYDNDGLLDLFVVDLTGTLEFTDPDAANDLRRFYRTVLR